MYYENTVTFKAFSKVQKEHLLKLSCKNALLHILKLSDGRHWYTNRILSCYVERKKVFKNLDSQGRRKELLILISEQIWKTMQKPVSDCVKHLQLGTSSSGSKDPEIIIKWLMTNHFTLFVFHIFALIALQIFQTFQAGLVS